MKGSLSCLIWNQNPWICLIAKFCEETKMPKFGTKKCRIWAFLTKNALFRYFWARVLKILLSYLKSASSNLSICKISWKKYLNLGQKMPDLGIFGLEFENNFVIFEIRTLKFVYLQNFTKKQKCLTLGPKMPDLGILGLEFENNIVIFEISTLEFI